MPVCAFGTYDQSTERNSHEAFDCIAIGYGRLCGSTGRPGVQGVPQTMALTKVDMKTVASGYRTSKVVGSDVVNEAKETVGTIDDLIVTLHHARGSSCRRQRDRRRQRDG